MVQFLLRCDDRGIVDRALKGHGFSRAEKVHRRLAFAPRTEVRKMDIKKIGSQPSGNGPADWFTGTVRVDPLFSAPAPARVVVASVTFESGARTAWHTHRLGQTLVVTAGRGPTSRSCSRRQGIAPHVQ